MTASAHALAGPDAAAAITNIAKHLSRVAEERPYAAAIYFPDGRDRRGRVRYTHFTYRQLDEASDRIARGLTHNGVGKGTRIALMVRPSLELFSLVFGIFKAGAVPVMIDPGIGLANMKSCLARARPEAFVGVPTAQLARLVLRWARSSIETVITVGPRGPWGGLTLERIERDGDDAAIELAATEREDVAAILFTSGSTGPPKGAIYTHGNFAAQVDSIRAMFDIRPGEIDLPTFPLFALFDPALSMTTVIPDMDPTRPAKADPATIAEAIEDFGVTNMFGSPALLNTLSRWGADSGRRLESLSRVISAGAPVPTDVLRRMRAMLPEHAEVFTPYGATECLPVACIESREVIESTARVTAEGGGVCVGRPVAGADVRVIPIGEDPIATIADTETIETGEIGEIVVRAPQASRAYFGDERATEGAKIEDGDAFFHRMGDLGYFDADGRLWFCGRKSQRIVGATKTWFTVQCERVFDAHVDVYRTALVGVTRAARTVPVVCVELEPAAVHRAGTVLGELRELARSSSRTQELTTFVVHPGFPVDVRHNAKIRREELADWVQREHPDA